MNYMRIGVITLDILADALYDLLKGRTTVGPRQEYDITRLYSEHRKLNMDIPTKGWGGRILADIIHYNTGDDIERIRLIRNEMQHARHYTMDDKTCTVLFDTIMDVLQRFDQNNKPTGQPYCHRAEEVKLATFTSFDYEQLKEKCSQEKYYCMADNIEIHHHHHYYKS